MRPSGLTLAIALALLAPATALATVQNPHRVTLLGGMLRLEDAGETTIAPSLFTLEYAYFVHPHWAPFASYNSILKLDGSFGLLSSGYDIGMSYCVGSCVSVREEVGDVLAVTRYSAWGFLVGAGVSLREFQLRSSTVGVSGPTVRADAGYRFRENMRAVLRVQISPLSNASRDMSFQNLLLGVGLLF